MRVAFVCLVRGDNMSVMKRKKKNTQLEDSRRKLSEKGCKKETDATTASS